MTDHHALAPDGGVEAALLKRADECRAHAEASFYPHACSEYRAKEAAFREAAQITALTTQQPSAAGRDTNCDESGRGDLNRTLYKVLRDFHVSNMADEDGVTGFPLVDLVSNDGCGIDTGEEQLRDLADELTGAALSLLPSAAGREEVACDAISRAKARRAARDASGEVNIEGSIYEGMAACLVRSGKTIAHVVQYEDAVAIAAALARPQRAAEEQEQTFQAGFDAGFNAARGDATKDHNAAWRDFAARAALSPSKGGGA